MMKKLYLIAYKVLEELERMRIALYLGSMLFI
jgi:hypothetical protein